MILNLFRVLICYLYILPNKMMVRVFCLFSNCIDFCCCCFSCLIPISGYLLPLGKSLNSNVEESPHYLTVRPLFSAFQPDRATFSSSKISGFLCLPASGTIFSYLLLPFANSLRF